MGRRSLRLACRAACADLPAPRGRGGRDLSRRRSPERLPGLIDSHAHLQHARFDDDRDAVIARAMEAGIERICVPGWDLASSEAALELASEHPGVVDAAVGVHPHHADEMNEQEWGRLGALVADRRTRAVGEIGLDYFRNLSPPEVQREAFARQLSMAAGRGLPVLVHDRDAHEDVAAALLSWGGRGVLHAFSGDAEMARRLVGAGFVISFALPVAFRSAAGPRAAAAELREGSFLVETDSPYLGPDAARRNEPSTVVRVVAGLARLRGVDPTVLVAPIRAAYEGVIGPRSG
jgi:TatD DNase family protein